jgi:hypothetical protein
MPPQQRLTIFYEDDTAPLLGSVKIDGSVYDPTCSTDGAHLRPYLLRILEQAESEIDFVEGRSTIGQISVEVLDVRRTASDQSTGWFTDLLTLAVPNPYPGIPCGGFFSNFPLANQENGANNTGEVDYQGPATFTHPNGTVYSIPSLTVSVSPFEVGISSTFRGTVAYLMFVGSDSTRFGAIPFGSAVAGDPWRQFVPVMNIAGTWYYSDNVAIPFDDTFTPNANDCIVGRIVADPAVGIGQIDWYAPSTSLYLNNIRVMGFRALVEQQATDGSWYTIANGPIGDVELKDDMVTYKFSIRDMRERERKGNMFSRSDGTLCLFPPGSTSGYGKMSASSYILPPAGGVKARFYLDPVTPTAGIAVVQELKYKIGAFGVSITMPINMDVDYTNMLMDISQVRLDDPTAQTLSMRFRDVGFRWRAWGSTGAWTSLFAMPLVLGGAFAGWGQAFVSVPGTSIPFNNKIKKSEGAPFLVLTTDGSASLPTNNQDIEVQMVYLGRPSEQFPLFIEKSFGQLLKDIYDGGYSTSTPRIAYDATAMASFVANTPQARLRITEPEDDMRGWVEKNIYKPLGYAPAIDRNGKIKPIKYALPDPSVSLTTLNNANVTEGSWKHSYADVITKVDFKYKRESPIKADNSVNFFFRQNIAERDVEIIDIFSSAAVLNEHVVEYDPVTIRSLADIRGGPLTGDILDELGTQLARARAKELFDRFAYGAQRMSIKALRSDTAVAALNVGDWVTVGVTWMPDYVTGKRGIDRLAQVSRIQDMDPIVRSMELIDAGPTNTPLSVPTVGAISASANRVSVPITSIPTLTEARVDYAINATEPSPSSGMWTYVGRTSVAATLYTPPVPDNCTVWVRARGEHAQRRPSVWTTSQSVAIASAPRTSNLSIELIDDHNPILHWAPNAQCVGLRVYYQVVPFGSGPTTFSTFVDIDGTTGEAELPITVRQTNSVYLLVESWTGFSGGTVTGSHTAGLMVYSQRLSEIYTAPLATTSQSQTTTVGTLTVTPVDPQYRVTKVAFRTQSGRLGTFSGWVDDTSIPYSTTVALLNNDTSVIEYRVYAVDMNGTENIILSSSSTFFTGVTGYLYDRCNIETLLSAANNVTVKVSSVAGGNVKMVRDLLSVIVARRSTGNMFGATTPVGVKLAAMGFPVTHNFTATVADCMAFGAVVVDCSAWGVDEHDQFIKDCLAAGLNVLTTGNDTGAVGFFPVATAHSATPVGQSIKATVASPLHEGWTAIPNDTDGGYRIDTVITGATTVLDYDIGAGVHGSVAAFVYNTPSWPGRLYHDQSLSNSVAVSTSDFTEYLYNIMNWLSKAPRLQGARPEAVVASPQTWIFERSPLQAGSGIVTFEASTTGYVSDRDMLVVPDKGRDTIGLIMRAENISGAATGHVRVRLTVVDPLGAIGSNIFIAVQSFDGVPASPTVVSGSSPMASGATIDYDIQRPAAGARQGRVTFKASMTGRADDFDSVEVLPADVIAPTLDLAPTISDTSYSIAFASTGSVQHKIDNGSYGASTSPVVVSRNAAGGADKVVTFKADLNGQTVYNSVTVPVQATVRYVVNGITLQRDSSSQFTVTWSVSPSAPVGSQFNLEWTVTESGASGHVTGAASPQAVSTTLTSTPHGTATVTLIDSGGAVLGVGKSKNDTFLL